MTLENEPKVLGISSTGRYAIVLWGVVYFLAFLEDKTATAEAYWIRYADYAAIYFGKVPDKIAEDAIKTVREYVEEGGERLEGRIESIQTYEQYPELKEIEAQYMKHWRLNKRTKKTLLRRWKGQEWAKPYIEAVEKTIV